MKEAIHLRKERGKGYAPRKERKGGIQLKEWTREGVHDHGRKGEKKTYN